ncbi:hypothetical protein KR059_011455 [Drosophila kikkawai]|nr:hypothetical protein KR059_011455 [Drosophila kikkawai]
MNKVYVLVIILSIFAHSTGVLYCPQGVSADSVLFLIMAPMALHKLKVKNDVWESQTLLGHILEFGILCLLVQVVLVAIWFPVNQVIQILMDFLCTKLPFEYIEAFKKNGATVCILAIELIVLLRYFSLQDVHGIYGSEDELVTESTLLVLAKRQKTLERRAMRMQRQY